MYTNDYEPMLSEIEIDTELGNTLKNCKDPNARINALVCETLATPIYTDGSKSETSKSVGSACVCNELRTTIINSTVRDASIFTAEALALYNAVEIAVRYPDRSFLVFSDSLSALMALRNPKHSIKTNPYLYEIRKMVDIFDKSTSNNSKIKFIWVPSHKGIQGNEEADEKAREAASKEPSHDQKIPFTDLREHARKTTKQNTTEL